MILLKAITETLEVLTTAAVSIDVSIAWVDVTTSAFSPSTTETNINTATTTTVLAAPAASTQRQVKLITVRNRSTTTAQTVTFKKDISATEYYITPDITLSAGDMLQYTDGEGWKTFDKNGREKINPTIDAGYNGRTIGFYKTGTAPDAVGYWYCTSKDAGYPGAFAVGTPGLNGRTTDGTTTTDNGCIPFQNPSTGSMYLKSCVMTSTIGHYNRWFDLLWINSGLVVTTTTAQAIASPTWPARDLNGSTDGDGLMIGLLVTATIANAAVNNTMTVNYTNSAGTAGRTATLSANVGNQVPATALIGTIVWFSLAAGDKGVRSIQGITLATTLVSGTISLLVARPIQGVPTTVANMGTFVDNGFGVRLYNGTCLLHCYQASSATATVFSGELVMIEK